ncbi:Hypothetical_protein [Hexamita inflata]|uniref:Hypothetical_protein n=1 Tax=Hexamita inflata TaxID=28002 RepID=A0AA86NXH4_9EUKA|nr:Hypothetical protein HINF_LOCUS14141 [Hexamita inflata]
MQPFIYTLTAVYFTNPRFSIINQQRYIYITSSRRHKQTSLRLSKAKHRLSHASVSTFKTGSIYIYKASKPQEIANLPPAIYPEIRNLQNQINQEGPQVPNQVNETVHQRQPPPSNANTTEQLPVQAEGNNQQSETEKREPYSGNQVSESGKTGPLTTP